MKITKSQLKQIIREELLSEAGDGYIMGTLRSKIGGLYSGRPRSISQRLGLDRDHSAGGAPASREKPYWAAAEHTDEFLDEVKDLADRYSVKISIEEESDGTHIIVQPKKEPGE